MVLTVPVRRTTISPVDHSDGIECWSTCECAGTCLLATKRGLEEVFACGVVEQVVGNFPSPPECS